MAKITNTKKYRLLVLKEERRFMSTQMERPKVNNSDRAGLKLWERVRSGKLDAHEAMATLRGLEPKNYMHLSTYKRLARFAAGSDKETT